jgi:hypothetical protein
MLRSLCHRSALNSLLTRSVLSSSTEIYHCKHTLTAGLTAGTVTGEATEGKKIIFFALNAITFVPSLQSCSLH